MTFEDFNYKMYNEWILVNPDNIQEDEDLKNANQRNKKNRRAISSD